MGEIQPEADSQEKAAPQVQPIPENDSVTNMRVKPSIWREFWKGTHKIFWKWYGLDQVAEDIDTHGDAVRKGAALRFFFIIIIVFSVLGFGLKGCVDSSTLEATKGDLSKSEGGRLEAQRQVDKFQLLYNQDQLAIIEIGSETKRNGTAGDEKDEKVAAIIAENRLANEKVLSAVVSNPLLTQTFVTNLQQEQNELPMAGDKLDLNAAAEKVNNIHLQNEAQTQSAQKQKETQDQRDDVLRYQANDYARRRFVSYLQQFAVSKGDSLVDSDPPDVGEGGGRQFKSKSGHISFNLRDWNGGLEIKRDFTSFFLKVQGGGVVTVQVTNGIGPTAPLDYNATATSESDSYRSKIDEGLQLFMGEFAN